MSSEIITTKRDTEIGRLLERVIRDHRKDISAYSKGHLNENNLYKPPEAGRVSWDSAKLPAIKLKKALKLEKEPRNKVMWEAVACFSAGSALKTDLPTRESSPDIDQLTKGLGIDGDNINLEEFDASYFIIPKPDSGFQVVPSLSACITKKDEVAHRKLLDSNVVEKHNLTDQGWYNGTRATKHFKLKPPSSDIRVHSKQWDEIIKTCALYNPLLGEIKNYYTGYLAYLSEDTTLDCSSNKDQGELKESVDAVMKLTEKVSKLEDSAMNLMKANVSLKEEHDVTECVLSDIKMSDGLGSAISPTAESSSSVDTQTATVAASVDQLRREILHKRAELDNLHSYQRRAMVPMEVHQCMVQCVQSAEIELQKQQKSLETLHKKQDKYSAQLDATLERLGLTPDQRRQLSIVLEEQEEEQS